jgi:hypothetical protein
VSEQQSLILISHPDACSPRQLVHKKVNYAPYVRYYFAHTTKCVMIFL